MTPGRIPLTEASERNLAALRRSMVRTGRFALHLLIADGPARAELRARLVAVSGEGGVPVLRFFAEGPLGADEVLRWLSAMEVSPLAGAVLVDGDSLVAAQEPILALNSARDRLAQLVTGPLLILLSPRSEVELSWLAPDLFDVRTATYEIEALPTQTAQAPASLPVEKVMESSASGEAVLLEPEALRARETSPAPPPLSALADAWLKLARICEARGDLVGAGEAAGEAGRLARSSGFGSAEGQALRIKARAALRTGHVQEAERALQEALALAKQQGDARATALTWGQIADVLQERGEVEAALRIRREEEVPVYERLGDVRSRAVTMGQIADVLQKRGELEEALRIRRNEQLPVYERLGDLRARAVTMGKIADVLQTRGEMDEALRIRREEQLPIFERLGDVRERAVTMGKIADVLQKRGELDEALRIRREVELPVYERLGDIRSRTVAMGKIADVLQKRGHVEEALRIRREEQLPVFERLGDVRERAVTMGKIADVLQTRGDLEEALRIRREEELPVYARLGDIRSRAVTMGKIADALQQRGNLEEALRIRREEQLPLCERLGATRDVVVCQTEIALNLLTRGNPGDRDAAHELLDRGYEAAERLQLPEAARIRRLQQRHGFLP